MNKEKQFVITILNLKELKTVKCEFWDRYACDIFSSLDTNNFT